jgi:phosphohistidine swiveling domain-containing protein
MWVHDLARADARCGGKAQGLARLVAGDLPVPPGFVIDDRAFRHVAGEIILDDPESAGHVIAKVLDRFATVALPLAVTREIDARADALSAPNGFAVRSSATIEDRNVGSAAGVYSSRTAVRREDLWHAIRGVWVSALTPLAVTYARRRGGPISIGVVVQAYVDGERVTVYTRRPNAPTINEVLVQRDTSITRVPRESMDPAVVLALRAEAAIGATAGADVELVGEHIVQARAIVHPPRRPQRSGAPPTVTSLLVADGRKWTWDIAHNPDPLSTAQSELVERVDKANAAPYSLRVCAGYLYSAARTSVVEPSLENLGDIESRLSTLVGGIGREARANIDATGRGREAHEDADATLSVDEAVDRYVKFYAIWSNELSPLVARARRENAAASTAASSATSSAASNAAASAALLAGSSSYSASAPPTRRFSVEGLLLGVARGELDEAEVIARLGVLSPSWDVVVPTYAERPELLRDAVARAREIVKKPRQQASGIFRPITDEGAHAILAKRADSKHPANLGERDDEWFARAQWMVRRALLARGEQLALDDGDVFWLPFQTLADYITVEDARRRAAAARAAAARATRWEMPLTVGGDEGGEPTLRASSGSIAIPPVGSSKSIAITPIQPVDTSRSPSGRSREPSYGSPEVLVAQARGDHALRGIGSGGRVQGRVVRFASLASSVTVGRGDVVVARAITPALAVMVIGCAAIVSETGGFLDHGAAMARELGIPCVVGCKDAWTILDDGMLVTVDGDSGLITTHA